MQTVELGKILLIVLLTLAAQGCIANPDSPIAQTKLSGPDLSEEGDAGNTSGNGTVAYPSVVNMDRDSHA